MADGTPSGATRSWTFGPQRGDDRARNVRLGPCRGLVAQPVLQRFESSLVRRTTRATREVRGERPPVARGQRLVLRPRKPPARDATSHVPAPPPTARRPGRDCPW